MKRLLILFALLTSAAFGAWPTGHNHSYRPSSVVQSGGRVSQLTDLIGTDHFTQATAGVQPFLNTDAASATVLSFPIGSNCWMRSTTLVFADRSFTVLIVRRAMESVYQVTWSGDNATFDAYGFVSTATTSTIDAKMMGANKVSGNPAPVNLEIQGMRGGTTAQGGASVIWYGGVYDTTQNGGATFTGADLCQLYNASAKWWYGDIYAIDVFDHRLNDTELANARAMLLVEFPSLRAQWRTRLIT